MTATKPKTKPFSSLDEILNENKGVPPVTAQQITEQFAQSLKKNKSGSGGNDNNQELLSVSLNILRNFSARPFSKNDFFISANYLDLDAEILNEYFENWIAVLDAAKLVHTTRIQDSCYTFEMFNLI